MIYQAPMIQSIVKKKQSLTFLDLFSGIGGFRYGLEKAGHSCIGYCEIDSYARQSYQSIFTTSNEVEMHDITKLSDEFIRSIGSVDVICGGFPCQAFSIAGKRKGFADTRGTLFFEIARFASILKPSYLFLENVKGLLNHEGGATFETILRVLDELGYDVEWQCINSKNYVPQYRERIYIIGRLRGSGACSVFPISRENRSIGSHTKRELFDSMNSSKGGNTKSKIIIKEATKQGYSEVMPGDSINFAFLNSNCRRGRVGKQRANTLLTNDQQCVVMSDLRIRKLTPLECWRLQAFPDWAFLAAKFGSREIALEIIEQEMSHYECPYEVKMSNTQLYKQAGNSVTTTVIFEIAKHFQIID